MIELQIHNYVLRRCWHEDEFHLWPDISVGKTHWDNTPNCYWIVFRLWAWSFALEAQPRHSWEESYPNCTWPPGLPGEQTKLLTIVGLIMTMIGAAFGLGVYLY